MSYALRAPHRTTPPQSFRFRVEDWAKNRQPHEEPAQVIDQSVAGSRCDSKETTDA